MNLNWKNYWFQSRLENSFWDILSFITSRPTKDTRKIIKTQAWAELTQPLWSDKHTNELLNRQTRPFFHLSLRWMTVSTFVTQEANFQKIKRPKCGLTAESPKNQDLIPGQNRRVRSPTESQNWKNKSVQVLNLQQLSSLNSYHTWARVVLSTNFWARTKPYQSIKTKTATFRCKATLC